MEAQQIDPAQSVEAAPQFGPETLYPGNELQPVREVSSDSGEVDQTETQGVEQQRAGEEGERMSLLSLPQENEQQVESSESAVPESPEGYEFSYPEGVQVDSALEGNFREFAHRNGISVDMAQKLVEFNCDAVQQQEAQLNEQVRDWCEEVRKMPGWQGNAFNEKISVAHRAVGRFVPPEVAQLLDSTGYGNHPAVVSMFYEIGKNMAEDRYVDAPYTAAKRDPASILYPNQGRY